MLFGVVLPLLWGCSTPAPLYSWGNYETLLWESYRADYGDVDPTSQRERLESNVNRILAEGGRIPPGVNAHLGYLCYLAGDRGAAVTYFVEEQERFPESEVFIRGVLSRMVAEAAPPSGSVAPGSPDPQGESSNGSPTDEPDDEPSASTPEMPSTEGGRWNWTRSDS